MLFGREKEIEEIVENCRSDRLTVIVADPGLGASALIEEGAVPALRSQGYITVIVKEWQGRFFSTNLKEAIASAVREQATSQFYAESERLGEMLRRIHAATGRAAAILLDQFEDYVRCHTGTDLSDSFDAELSNAISSREGKFVIALQEHALPAFQRFSQYVPNLLGFRLTLSPLVRAAAEDAARWECERAGIEIEPAVMEEILSSPAVSLNGGIHPFYLKTGLTRLLEAESRLKSRTVGASTLAMFGGADRLILESLDGKIGELTGTHRELLFRWCNLLISPTQLRLAVTGKALEDYSGKLNRFALTLLPAAMERGLLRSVETPDCIRYEIARDSLLPMMRDWWGREEAARAARNRARFRIRSISVAVGSILALYAAWIVMSSK